MVINTLIDFMRHPILLCSLFACIGFSVMKAQSTETMNLYPAAIPNAKQAENREKTEKNAGGIPFTTETSIPTLTRYSPAEPNGTAVVICPGGGYMGTACDHEGQQVAEALNEFGITAFVLKYRLPDDRTCTEKSWVPLQDAQQAIRIVRTHAAEWNVNPHKIGIMGFSAGGHLASTAATHFQRNADAGNKDTTSVRPDFVALIYPVISFSDKLTHGGSRDRLLGPHPDAAQIQLFSNELQVTHASPPAFLVHAGDDEVVPVGNSIAYYEACLRNRVPAEMHLYPAGGHGFGLRNPKVKDEWLERMVLWMGGL
jgi:acetyl esterase/lipase